jgi:hypothetical protein
MIDIYLQFLRCKDGELVRLRFFGHGFDVISHISRICVLIAAMEDAHVTLLTLEENTTDKNTFFAVYDGHGGKLLANSFTDSSLELSLILHRKHRREVRGKERSQAANIRRGIS